MGQQELHAVLESIRTAADPRGLLIELTLEQLAKEDEVLAEVARLAALPRRLDQDVIGALRGGEQDPSRDSALLARIQALDFIDTSRAGRPAYHDSVRSELLRQLREDPAWRPKFEEASARLVGHFGEQNDRAYDAFVDVRRVAPILRRANPDRLHRISETAERALIEPAVEALYHAILVDADRGCAVFEMLFDRHERSGLLVTCRALRAAVEANLREFAPATFEGRRAWLAYWDGRLHAALDEPAEAEAAYRRALDSAEGSIALRIKTLESLAELLLDTYRLGEALDYAREHLRLARSAKSDEDEWSALLGIARLEFRLGRVREAVRTFEDLQAATAPGDAMRLVFAQNLRAAATYELVGPKEAIRELMEALDMARTTARATTVAASTVAGSLASIFERDYPRLMLTALTESEALDPAPAWNRDVAAYAESRIEHLLDAGLVRHAADALVNASEVPDAALRATVLSAAARVASAEGKLQEAAETWTAVLELRGGGAPTPEEEVLALLNRADLRARLGLSEAAESDCEHAADAAKRLGHVPFQGMAGVIRARLAMNAGRLADARALLDEAEPALHDAPRFAADHSVAVARLAQRSGRSAEAVERYRETHALVHRLGMLDRMALNASEAVVAAIDASDWRAAAEQAEQTVAVARLLAERAATPTDPAQIEVDRLYAAGMQAFHGLPAPEIADDDEPPLEQAVRLLSDCATREPRHPLYHLGLAYTHLQRGAWDEATAAFEAAHDCAPELFEETVIADRPITCLMLAAAARRRAGEFDGAFAALGEAARRAERRPAWLATVELALGDTLVAASRPTDARDAYARAAEHAASAGQARVGAAALARGGALRASAGDPGGAEILWRDAVGAYARAGASSPYWDLLRDCSILGEAVTDDDSAVRALRAFRDNPTTGGSMQTFQPELRAALPDSWFVKESISLLAPDGSANVIASSESLDASIDTDEYARNQGDLLASEFPGFEEHEVKEAELLGGRRTVVRQFSWRPPDGEPVTQIQLYYVHDGRGYTATATTPTSRFAELELELRQVLEGLALDAP